VDRCCALTVALAAVANSTAAQLDLMRGKRGRTWASVTRSKLCGPTAAERRGEGDRCAMFKVWMSKTCNGDGVQGAAPQITREAVQLDRLERLGRSRRQQPQPPVGRRGGKVRTAVLQLFNSDRLYGPVRPCSSAGAPACSSSYAPCRAAAHTTMDWVARTHSKSPCILQLRRTPLL
jgi:hypothetical protein